MDLHKTYVKVMSTKDITTTQLKTVGDVLGNLVTAKVSRYRIIFTVGKQDK